MLIKTGESQDDGGIGEKLDALIKLTAVSVLGDKTGGEAIDVLLRAGLDNDMIADLAGTTPGTFRARRSDNKKKDSSKKGMGK
jgi:hypothetical protein